MEKSDPQNIGGAVSAALVFLGIFFTLNFLGAKVMSFLGIDTQKVFVPLYPTPQMGILQSMMIDFARWIMFGFLLAVVVAIIGGILLAYINKNK